MKNSAPPKGHRLSQDVDLTADKGTIPSEQTADPRDKHVATLADQISQKEYGKALVNTRSPDNQALLDVCASQRYLIKDGVSPDRFNRDPLRVKS